MDKKKIVIGSRESLLAVRQSEIVLDYLKENHPELDVSLLTMKTTGDKILDKKLNEIGGKGLFVKELDAALMDGRTDISVHSLKDMPNKVPKDLPIICYSKREDPRDVLVLPEGVKEIDFSKPIGTSSQRRIIQLRELFPDASFESARGNLQTRLKKLDEGKYSAIILAAAGLKRLGLENRISRYFAPEELLPSAGQGILAIQGRTDTDTSLFNGFYDEASTSCAIAERSFVEKLDGGCSSPIAAYAVIDDDEIYLRGIYVPEGTEKIYRGEIRGPKENAGQLGEELAAKLLKEVM